LKRKEIKRGRKPGKAGEWASLILASTRTSKNLDYRLGEIMAYSSDGQLIDENDQRVIHAKWDEAIPCPRSFAVSTDSTLAQTQSRIGGQIRGAIAKQETPAGWEALEPDERTAKEIKEEKANEYAGYTVLAITF
jgi:hypothetical protein